MNAYTRTLTGLLTGTFLAFALSANPSQAQDVRYLSPDASSCDIFRGLSRSIPANCATPAEKFQLRTVRGLGRTRGLVLYDEAQPVHVANSSTENEVVTPADDGKRELAVAFRAEFEFDSDELTPEAIAVADRIARVLKHDLMRNKVIEIEGHADATGAEAYNMTLSVRRAAAVKEYLVSRHQIDASRLKVIGKGEADPFDVSDPEAGVNRRVEFKNITG